MPRAIAEMKAAAPDLIVMTDVCVDEYTDHGHCGVLKKRADGTFDVDNDATIEILAKMALMHAKAGADVVAPSDMMDGRVKRIRKELDANGFEDTALLSYAVKYASAFYGPFRDALDSAPKFGDKKTYQMDYRNSKEAIREALAGFAGVNRRFTRVGEVGGVTIIDDYGHHPVEIAAVLKAARQATKGRIIAVHQPHRYTRLSHLFEEFCTCFNDADVLLLTAGPLFYGLVRATDNPGPLRGDDRRHTFEPRDVAEQLRRDLAVAVEQALFIALAPRLHRQPVHRLGELQRAQMDVVFVVRIVQHIVKADFVDLGNRPDVAGLQGRHFQEVLALQAVQMGDLERAFGGADKQLRVAAHRALVHPEHAELAHERVDHHLEHMGQHVQVGVGLGGKCPRRLSRLAAVEQGRVGLGRAGRQPGQCIEQLQHAGAGLG